MDMKHERGHRHKTEGSTPPNTDSMYGMALEPRSVASGEDEGMTVLVQRGLEVRASKHGKQKKARRAP